MLFWHCDTDGDLQPGRYGRALFALEAYDIVKCLVKANGIACKFAHC